MQAKSMGIGRDINKTFLRWKFWGILTVIVLVVSYYLRKDSVVRVIGDYTLLGGALSYPGYLLFWLSILSFTYAWFSGRIKFLTRKRVVCSIPLLIMVYLDASFYLYEEFVAFRVLPTPFVTEMDFSLFVFSINAAMPFKLFLETLGLWGGGGLIAISGPSFLGFYVVAVIYSVAIYVLWSVVAFIFRK